MAYPGPFHRLVVIGTLYTAETFNFTMSIVPVEAPEAVEAVDTELLEAVADDVAVWWPKLEGSGGVSIMDDAVLTEVKLNRIGADGRYMDNTAMTHIFTPPVASSIAGNVPAQLSLAVTLRTDRARGRGSRGRFYLPPIARLTDLDGTGRISAGDATDIANGAKALIDAINTTYWARNGGLSVAMRVGVASDIGTGIFEEARTVEVGRVPDVIRSRRSSLDEDHQAVTITPA